MESFTTAIQAVMKTDIDFSQQIKQRLVLQSNSVKNPYRFIASLLTEGVLSDESSDPEAVYGLKGMLVQLAITIASSKGKNAVCGLIKALEGSGNCQIVAALRTWAKEAFGIENDGELSTPKEDASATQPLSIKKLPQKSTSPAASSSTGTKLIDKITSRLEKNFMNQLQRRLLGKASEILNTTEFCASLVTQNVLEDDSQLATGSEVQGVQLAVNAIQAACSKKSIGSLVLALQRSNNERFLVETDNWLATSQARKQNYPVSVKSLTRKPRPAATGIFAATSKGLIVLDLQTSEATTLTTALTNAVAVNHKLKKVYWSEGAINSSILRANFDGSAVETVLPPQRGDCIYMLAVNEPSGNVYFSLFCSDKIQVCSALGENCAVAIPKSSAVKHPISIALDSENGFIYWGNMGTSQSSLGSANLDGSNASIISTEFMDLHGITLPQSSTDVLYWVDTWEKSIGTFDVHSGTKQKLVELRGRCRLRGIQVDTHKIYFGNNRNIHSVNRDSGEELTTLFESDGSVNNLALFTLPVKKSLYPILDV